MSEAERGGDLDLLCWLVAMGQSDRAQYRVLREAMWAMFVKARTDGRSPRSDKPSNCS